MQANDLQKIQDYGIIGDCRAAALIGRNGSLDWLCWPRFDSSAMFAALLDPAKGGRWQIAPAGEFHVERRYLPGTNILETTFRGPGGTGVLTDLMPVCSEEFKKTMMVADHEILRRVECTDGEIEWIHCYQPRADYGQKDVPIVRRGKLGCRAEINGGMLWMRNSDLPHHVNDNGAGTQPIVRERFQLRAGERVYFSLSYSEDAPAVLPLLDRSAEERIGQSRRWWERWSSRVRYDGPYRDAVVRSALTLKLLTYAPSGAIVASPTTSLPEWPGADMNWDYRYCWLRDSSLTVRAMLGLGYREEAEEFLEWMLHATRLTQPELRILYNVFGGSAPKERELPLRGYRDSRPVRIGNEARGQLQLDVYGEVIDAATQIAFDGVEFDRVTQKVLRQSAEYVIKNWNCPDEGIWEPRSGRQNHTHSRLLCWVALDRLCKLVDRQQVRHANVGRITAARDAIVRDIRENAWNEKLQSYTSTLGGDSMDASLLLLSWYGFEKPDSPRMRSTYRAITSELRAGPDLLYRYRPSQREGAFGICCFWEAEYLAMGGGSMQQARVAIDRLTSYANDLGLFSEEIDPTSRELLGNFPQGFTHIGLINAALSLEARAKGETQLPHRDEAAATEVAA
jgi:GH15 family glucan-1,4-alpha-glucosidase